MNESEEFKMAFHKNDSDKNVFYEVIADYGAFGQPDKYGYQLRLREVSWNGKEPRYDIRPWMTDDNDEEKCRKGITLSGEETEALYHLLKGIAETD